MHFVVLAEHSAEICPISNAQSMALLLEMAPQIPKIAEKNGVRMVAGPFINREHLTVIVVETERAEALDDFLVEARLQQWNQIRVLPSRTMEESMKELTETSPLF